MLVLVSVGASTGDVSVSATGSVAVAGTLGLALGDVVVSATGSIGVSGAVGVTTDKAVLTAFASVPDAGSVAFVLGAVSATSTAKVLVSGGVDLALGEISAFGQVVPGGGRSGALSVVLDGVSALGVGSILVSGAVLTGEFEVFGPEDGLVDVLLMDSPQLEAAREVAVMRLAEQGIYNASEWTDYRPHMTLGPKGSAAHYTVPWTVSLYPMELWYGDRKIKLV